MPNRSLLLIPILALFSLTTHALPAETEPCLIFERDSEIPVRGVALLAEHAAIGASTDVNASENTGIVHIYRRVGSGWFLEGSLLGSDTVVRDEFGWSVDLWRDGEDVLLAAGAPGRLSVRGAVYVFRHDGDNWVEEAILVAPTPRIDDSLGWNVNGGGGFLAAGARDGRTYLFERESPGTWVFDTAIDVLVAPRTNTDVSIYDDGADTYLMTSGTNLFDSALRIYRRDADGWTTEFEVNAAGAIVRVDLSEHASGPIAAASARTADRKIVAVFHRRPNGRWRIDQRIEPDGIDGFGWDVAFAGRTLVAGSRSSAHVFRRFGGGWGQVDTLEAPPFALFRLEANGTQVIVSSFYGTRILDAAGADCGCLEGSVNAGTGSTSEVLLINGSTGGESRTVRVEEGESIMGQMLLPPSGGTGYFFVQANDGRPSGDTITLMPQELGLACFPYSFFRGANSRAVWNAFGYETRVGASHYFDGTPLPDPPLAPSTFLDLAGGDTVHLSSGTVLTLQGFSVDLAAGGPLKLSATNGVVLEVN